MKTEILIIGSGMVGMSLAYQLKKRALAKNITILEKEDAIGKHSSGRNSGVIHAGLYYKPNTLKAKVCVKGGIRLKEWIKNPSTLPIDDSHINNLLGSHIKFPKSSAACELAKDLSKLSNIKGYPVAPPANEEQ